MSTTLKRAQAFQLQREIVLIYEDAFQRGDKAATATKMSIIDDRDRRVKTIANRIDQLKREAAADDALAKLAEMIKRVR